MHSSAGMSRLAGRNAGERRLPANGGSNHAVGCITVVTITLPKHCPGSAEPLEAPDRNRWSVPPGHSQEEEHTLMRNPANRGG